MVKIRLKRLGYKKNPIFRIIVINSREKREGKPVAQLGYYNPKSKELKLNKELALEWIKKGAQPTETVQYLINNSDENGALVRKEAPEAKKLSKKAQAKVEAGIELTHEPVAETAPAVEEAAPEVTTETPAEEAETAEA